MALGTIGAFLVLEEKGHAQARGAKPLARIAAVASDHVRRTPGAVTGALERMWSTVKSRLDPAHAAVISGASGVQPATSEEREFLAAQGLAVRATGTHFGHGLEPQFPANIAIAAAALGRGRLFAPADAFERAMEAARRCAQVVVTSIGHWRGEGLALVEAVELREKRCRHRPVVVVTGYGIVTSLGAGAADNWAKLSAGQSGIREITRFATDGLKTRIAGTVDFVP